MKYQPGEYNFLTWCGGGGGNNKHDGQKIIFHFFKFYSGPYNNRAQKEIIDHLELKLRAHQDLKLIFLCTNLQHIQ